MSLIWTQPLLLNHQFNLINLVHLLIQQTFINHLVQEMQKWDLSNWDCLLIPQNQQLKLKLTIHRNQQLNLEIHSQA